MTAQEGDPLRRDGATWIDATWITVCTTCKREDWREGEAETSGERLAALVEAAVDGRAGEEGAVRVRRHACLMGCSHACNAAVQACGKMAYTLGRLAPEPEAAAALDGLGRAARGLRDGRGGLPLLARAHQGALRDAPPALARGMTRGAPAARPTSGA